MFFSLFLIYLTYFIGLAKKTSAPDYIIHSTEQNGILLLLTIITNTDKTSGNGVYIYVYVYMYVYYVLTLYAHTERGMKIYISFFHSKLMLLGIP